MKEFRPIHHLEINGVPFAEVSPTKLVMFFGVGHEDSDCFNVDEIRMLRDQWHIEIDQGKTGKKLAITISPAVETVLKRAKLMEPFWPRTHVIRTKWGLKYSDDGFRAMWQRYCRTWEKAGNARFHFHDLRAKSISDNLSLDSAYLLAGHIDIKMTRRVYDRARRKVEPLR